MALTSTLSFKLQTPNSSQKHTAADVTDATWKFCRANLYAPCWACWHLQQNKHTVGRQKRMDSETDRPWVQMLLMLNSHQGPVTTVVQLLN